VFEREWEGLYSSCVRLDEGDEDGDQYIADIGDIQCNPLGIKGDIRQEAEDSIKMNRIDGYYICGKRGGSSFKNALRINIETGECPEGSVPCSVYTDA
jgi:hypothetical protein